MKMLSGFKKDVAKIEGVTGDSSPPAYWTTSGNYVLNKILGGTFSRAAGQGRLVGIVGPSGCLPAGEWIDVYVMHTKPFYTPVSNEGEPIVRTCEVRFAHISHDDMIKELKYHEQVVPEDPAELKQVFDSYCDDRSGYNNIEDLADLAFKMETMLLVSTPDGFQPILQIFNKKPRPIYKIATSGFSVRCSEDHLVETYNGWVLAKDLVIDQLILTEEGMQPLTEKVLQGIEAVYDFEVGHENHRYWADGISSHNSGKSYLLCNFMKQSQQEQEAFVLAIDSENALDDEFVGKIGVDTSENNYMYLSVITIPHIKEIVSKFIAGYKETNETRKVFVAIDSLGMLLTDTEYDHLEKGVNKGDQGQRAKQLKSMLRGFVQQIKNLNIQIFVTDQVYVANQDSMNNGTNDGQWVVNSAVKYSLSNLLLVTKLKLRSGEDVGEVIGVKMKCEAIKTRFTKPFQKVVIEVPYETGMDPRSGLREVAVELGIIKSGAWCTLLSTSEKFRWGSMSDEIFNEIMRQADLLQNVAIGKFVEEEEEILEGTEVSIKQRRLDNFAKFKEQNPDYVPEGAFGEEELKD